MRQTIREKPKNLPDPVSRLLYLLGRAGSAAQPDTSRSDRTGNRYIIGLAGYPGSGKTTLTHRWETEVQAAAGTGKFLVLGMDGFHLSKAVLRAMDDPETAFARRGAPYTFDPERLVEKLKEIRAAAGVRPVGWPGFEHGVGDPVDDEIHVPPGCRLIVVEGIYTLLRSGAWAGLEGLFDECWFLDTPLETSMERLYHRHQEAWGMSPEKARARADGNDRLNCEHIMPGRDHADFLVRG